MAGSVLGQLAPVMMGLVGIISILRARRGHRGEDREAERHIATRAEMERRMAAYLAAREDGR